MHSIYIYFPDEAVLASATHSHKLIGQRVPDTW